MIAGWSEDQIEHAAGIVNDIAEDIDNNESRELLRQALAIYADLLDHERQRRHRILASIMQDVSQGLL